MNPISQPPRRRPATRTAAALAALVAAVPAVARAHQQSLSYGDLQVSGASVEVRLRLDLAELRGVTEIDPDHDGRTTAAEVARLGEGLARSLLSGLELRAGGAPCPLQPGARAELAEPGGLACTGTFRCPAEVSSLEVRLPLLELLPPGHTHLARISFGGGEVAERVAQTGSASYTVERQDGGSAVARLLRLGVEHIFTGYDHIAFLLGLLLLGGSLRRLIGIVTSFTVAHSVTLALATLHVLEPPARLVEALIAASIVAVAVENLWALRLSGAGRERVLGHRWLFTFAFGLVHGFGFADALRELHLPRGELALDLLSFNLGVELGQLCIVLLAVPLFAQILRHPRLAARAPQLLSATIGLLGAGWLLQRLLPS